MYGLETNVQAMWRMQFVLNEGMLEMECTNLTIEQVLKTSGHVDRFTELMVKDRAKGQCFPADKLLEDAIDDLIDANPTFTEAEKEVHWVAQRQADAYTSTELDDLLSKNGVKPPEGNDFEPSFLCPEWLRRRQATLRRRPDQLRLPQRDLAQGRPAARQGVLHGRDRALLRPQRQEVRRVPKRQGRGPVPLLE